MGSAVKKTKTKGSSRSQAKVVSAIVVNSPDMTNYVALQNLLDYSLQCLTNIMNHPQQSIETKNHFKKCVKKLETTFLEKDTLPGKELQRLLREYLEESEACIDIIETFYSNPQLSSEDVAHTDLLLVPRISNLQWLSVCLIEENKKQVQQAR
ncbi:hypothetical protein QA601_03855 [Chitinispirillales bacterium ANBcel5]|uniref:hypothetical protein n=1 Tax=Cellulosispirillum alkaliphilum TaxID=3039283 RepID=UPI002A5434F3|nr:hypothetical protein [Chitinispirillales bacterium ANBcel5]